MLINFLIWGYHLILRTSATSLNDVLLAKPHVAADLHRCTVEANLGDTTLDPWHCRFTTDALCIIAKEAHEMSKNVKSALVSLLCLQEALC